MAIGATSIQDPKQIIITLDHDIQNKDEKNLKKYRLIQEFAKKHGVQFYPAGRGIGHQIMIEEGHAFPGQMAVASDSHSNMYGGVGCLGTAVVRTDAASIWATGTTWWQIPPIAKVTFLGTLPKGVTGKDVIVALCGLFSRDEVLNHAIEFTGSPKTMASLPVDDRLAIANMTTEWGALTGLFPIDDTLHRWLRYKATEAALYAQANLDDSLSSSRLNHARIDEFMRKNALSADPGAKHAKRLYLDLSTLAPYVSGPNSVKVATRLELLEKCHIHIQKAYLVSCTNSRASDLAAAANVFRQAKKNGKRHQIWKDDLEFYIAAASQREQEAAESSGDWQVLLDAGAKPLPAGCGPCIGLGVGLLKDGEVGISASNRNFKGRMGSRDAQAYLASPEVVAASALKGSICGPDWWEKPKGWSGIVCGEGEGNSQIGHVISADQALESVIGQLDTTVEDGEKAFGNANAPRDKSAKSTEPLTQIHPNFPPTVTGEILFCDADNINTDGIYPGKLTYQDDVSRDHMARACMSNYDPSFPHLVKPGDILVSGFNFGTGSSREQSATCILANKIPLVVAGSFGNIFARNSVNNALMGLEVPRLIQRLRERFSVEMKEEEGDDEVGVMEPARNKDSLDSPPPGEQRVPEQEKVLTRRTGWTLTWDVRRSMVVVQEGKRGKRWEQRVGEVPPNVQEIVAEGGLESWVRSKIGR